MIPKIIHYCWFGRGELPNDVITYMASWKKHCPDYVIKLWNEDNFDLNINQYVKEAYLCKKYAFVADYVRLYALYHEGGLYMDTDIEVLRSLDSFLSHQAFSGFEDDNNIQTGIIGAEKGHQWIKQELDLYEKRHFIVKNGAMDTAPNVRVITANALNYGLIKDGNFQVLENGLAIYPKDFFCPMSWKDGKITMTNNTHVFHHFSASWTEDKRLRKAKQRYGELWGLRRWKLQNICIKIISYIRVL